MSQYLRKSIISTFTTVGKLGLTGLALSVSLSFSAVAADIPLTTPASGEFVITLNNTQILHLPGAASAIVVGNPNIADISVHSPDTIFVVGRGYGQTNLIALDEFGQTILSANITVKNASTLTGVRIINIGEGQESYNCATQCLPAPILGDDPAFIGSFSGQATVINNIASGPISSFGSSQLPSSINAGESFGEPETGFSNVGQSVRGQSRRNAEF